MDSALPTAYALRGKERNYRKKKRNHSPNNTVDAEKFQLMTEHVLWVTVATRGVALRDLVMRMRIR
jgi:hypothetical protein